MGDFMAAYEKRLKQFMDDKKSGTVEARNRMQSSRMCHPLTCGNGRCDDRHKAYQAIHGGDFGQLVAVEDGWLCPVCNWKQDLTLGLIYSGDDPPKPSMPTSAE